MKKLIQCSVSLNLALLLWAGFTVFQGFTSHESLVGEVDAHHDVQPAKSPSFFESKSEAATLSPATSSAATLPSTHPTNNNMAMQPPFPSADILIIPGAEGEAAVPAVFGVPDNDVSLNRDQMEKINEIAENFTREIKAGSTNLNDPAYLARWQKAQADADERLRFVLGQEDYLKYTLAVGIMDISK